MDGEGGRLEQKEGSVSSPSPSRGSLPHSLCPPMRRSDASVERKDGLEDRG